MARYQEIYDALVAKHVIPPLPPLRSEVVSILEARVK